MLLQYYFKGAFKDYIPQSVGQHSFKEVLENFTSLFTSAYEYKFFDVIIPQLYQAN